MRIAFLFYLDAKRHFEENKYVELLIFMQNLLHNTDLMEQSYEKGSFRNGSKKSK